MHRQLKQASRLRQDLLLQRFLDPHCSLSHCFLLHSSWSFVYLTRIFNYLVACRWLDAKVSPMWSTHGYGDGLTCTKMSWSMWSIASMHLISSVTVSVSTHITMKGWYPQALVRETPSSFSPPFFFVLSIPVHTLQILSRIKQMPCIKRCVCFIHRSVRINTNKFW